MYLLSDYINIVLKNITKKQYIFLLSLLLIKWCIFPSFLLGSADYSNIDWFIVLYMIGGFIRLYPIKAFENNKKLTLILFGSILLGISSMYILNKLYYLIKIEPTHFTLPMHQIIPLAISICMFLIFNNLNIKENRIINKISACTLGIYLIHQNLVIRYHIWKDMLKVDQYVNSQYLVLYEIFAVAIVFLVCMVIDLIRQFIFDKFIYKFLNFIEVKIKDGTRK